MKSERTKQYNTYMLTQKHLIKQWKHEIGTTYATKLNYNNNISSLKLQETLPVA